ISLFTRLRVSWTFALSSPQRGQAWLSFLALTCTSMLSSAPIHWLTISNSGRSRGTMIPWFGSISLALCPFMVCFSGIACPLFNLDWGFYSLERKDKLIALFFTLFSYSPFAFTRKDREPCRAMEL